MAGAVSLNRQQAEAAVEVLEARVKHITKVVGVTSYDLNVYIDEQQELMRVMLDVAAGLAQEALELRRSLKENNG